MKFREWEDFASEINEYGRMGYVKKQSSYNPFTKVNLMIMEHRTRFDEVVFILYPDDESFDRDYDEAAYLKSQTRSDKFLEEIPKQRFDPKIDHRTRDNRSEKYPSKPGEKKEPEKAPPRQDNPTPPRPKPGPTPPRPKPGPIQKRDDQK